MMPRHPCPPVAVLLLAAGHSRRMGAVETLLLPVAAPGQTGEPMVRHAACLYLELGLPVTVVIAPGNSGVIQALAGLDITLAVNADPLAEQADSLRTGLTSMPLAAPGLLIALADQPLLAAADIAELLARFASNTAKICIPRHDGKRGNPVILPAAIARQLRDDPAAPTPRAYMDQHPGQLVWLDTPSTHFTQDIDTPQDAARLLPVPLKEPLP